TDFAILVDKATPSEALSIITRWKRNNNYYPSQQTKALSGISEPPNFANICYQLHTQDKKLAKIIDSVGPCALARQHAGFDFLVDAIIGQQLSKNAADTIILRFRKLFPSGRAMPRKFLSLSREEVLSTGISKRKCDYIRDLAQKVDSKQLNLSQLQEENDAAVRRTLKNVKGIGNWTVDMYLLFGLARLDVFPAHDLALRKVMSTVYGLDVNDIEAAKKISEKWKPYRSVGSWYLYKFGNMRA
ncbi:unnamed protein product, partial [marine sediment metagenome]